jgi:hypothetical protein
MTWREALERIESHEFAASVNIASHLGMFLAIASESEATRYVRAQLKDVGNVAELATRAYKRTQEPVDPRYENRWDVPLAVYLWLLVVESPQYALPVAYSVLVTPQCWWARQLARRIVSGAYKTEGTAEPEVLSLKGTSWAQVVNATNAGEGIQLLVFSAGITGGEVHFLASGDTQQPISVDIVWLESFGGQTPHWNARTEDARSSPESIGVS